MKIAVITTYARPRNMRRELLDAIAARGHQITMIAPETQDVMGPPLAELGGQFVSWPVDRTGIDPIGDARAAAQLTKILRAVRPDAALVYQVKAVLLAPLAARLAGVGRIVALVNGLGAVFDSHGFGLTQKARLARFAYGLSLRAVHQIVFQNKDDPELLRSFHLLSPGASWRVVPGSGVDLDKLSLQPPHTKPATFTLVSRLLVSKGIRELVAAARTIRARYPDTRFRLVGQLEAAGHPDGIARAELDGWVAEGLVDYLGFTDDIPGVLAATTVFVLPSYYREGIPRTNLEALAVGRPIVTTDWVGCRETVEDGINGFLVPPKDPVALADRMERYLREPGLVEQHGRASRALAEKRFDIRKVNELMIATLESR